ADRAIRQPTSRLRHLAESPRPNVLGRLAMSRQIQGVDGPSGRQRLVVEQPVVEVAAKAVDQDCHITSLTAPQIAQRAAADHDLLWHGTGLDLDRRLYREAS